MRWLVKSLVVSVLAAVLVLAVIGLEKYYVSKLIEQARGDSAATERTPDPAAQSAAEEIALESLSSSEHHDKAGNELAVDLSQRLIEAWQRGRQVVSTPRSGPVEEAGKTPKLVNGAEVATARSIAAPAAAGPSLSEQLAAGPLAAEPSANTAIRPVSSIQAAGKSPRVNALAGMEAIDLMRQLHQDDRKVAAAARAELVRRGFSEVDLESARQLFDPDPAVRKRVARAVPRLESVDAVPWLLWLCHDEDADVRMTAVTLLATTGDPRILEQVEALARQDADPRIHELADQIGQQRDIAGSRGGSGGEQSHPNFTHVSGQR